MITAEEMSYAAGLDPEQAARVIDEEILSHIEMKDFMEFLGLETAAAIRAGAFSGQLNPEKLLQVLALGFFTKGWIAHSTLVGSDADSA